MKFLVVFEIMRNIQIRVSFSENALVAAFRILLRIRIVVCPSPEADLLRNFIEGQTLGDLHTVLPLRLAQVLGKGEAA